MAATSLVTSRPVLGELGIELPDDFRAWMEARDWSLDRESITEAGRLLPAELVHRFGVAGTPSSCRARLQGLLEACPQISQLAIVPFAPRTGTVHDTVRRFIEEVPSPAAAMSGGRS
jgi:5,10-methylenetetrahydromethanopterin reductase